MSETITREQAADRIALFAREGRLIQGEWHNEQDGRELACLLGAIGSDIGDPEDCPASVMPAWMAHLLPELFDGVRKERAIEFGKRFADALRTGNTDETVLRQFLVRTIAFAVDAVRLACEGEEYFDAVLAATGQVSDLLAAGVPSDDPRMSAARDAAMSAARDAAMSAARSEAEAAARSAAWSAARSAAEAAAWSAARAAAWSAAWSAARDAAMSAARAAAWSAAWSAAMSAAEAAAYEALFDKLIELMAA